MKIGTQTDGLAKFYGMEKSISILAKTGFDIADISLFGKNYIDTVFKLSPDKFTEYFTNLRKIADDCGIIIDQIHSPFPTLFDGDDEAMKEFRFELQVKSAEAAAILGARYMIVHPQMPGQRKYNDYYEETKELNMNFYSRLLPYLKQYNVKAAIENMFSYDREKCKICPTTCTTAEEIIDYIDTLNDDMFTVCLDIGHTNLIHCEGFEQVTPVNMIRTLGKRIETLHVHDNNGINDDHTVPYLGNINWDDVMAAFNDIGYEGIFTFEADGGFIEKLGKPFAKESRTILRKIGQKLVKKTDL